MLANVNILDGNAKDLVKECSDFEEKITKAGGIDLFVGGKSSHTNDPLPDQRPLP